MERTYENRKFKFGSGETYLSKLSHKIKIKPGNSKFYINVSVVDADIPLLLGVDYQKQWGMVFDIGEKEVYLRETNEYIALKQSKSNHWKLPIQGSRTWSKEAENLVLCVKLEQMEDMKLRKHIVRVHKNLCHRSEGQMIKLFQVAGKLNSRIRKAIKDVTQSCTVCKLFRKTPPRPRVAMPKAYTNNEVVSMDLAERRQHGKYILYVMDELSGWMVGKVIGDKKPETIIRNVNKRCIQ